MINEALRLIRIFHNINQSKFAEELDISRSYLCEIESGKKSPSIELVEKYSHIFNIPTSSLFIFSERLADRSFKEAARVKIAKKIVNIMNWIVETEDIRDDIGKGKSNKIYS